MSNIKVEVTKIKDVRPHANADSLELATVVGWQVCVKKGVYRDGDSVVYFEQGTVLPRDMAEALGVSQYLSEKTDIQGDRVLVIHRVTLRGEPSFGLVIPAEPGKDVTEHFHATKFAPPVREFAADAAPPDPRFPAYTDIENMRSYPDIFTEGEPVIATEKIHGTNARVGFVTEAGVTVPMAGSRSLRREQPPEPALWESNTYWFPHTMDSVKALFQALVNQRHHQAVLYGEVFGPGIQTYTYGSKRVSFRAFDLMIDGQYVDHDAFVGLCQEHGIPHIPEAYRGPFALATIKSISDGESLVGGAHGREGVVVKPLHERNHPTIGRVILKYVGDTYLFGKAGQQDTTDQ